MSQNHLLPCPCSAWEVVEGTEWQGALAAPWASLLPGCLAGSTAPVHRYSLKVLAERS